MTETQELIWDVKLKEDFTLENPRGVEKFKFEAGRSLNLPCTWRFRIHNPLQVVQVYRRTTRCFELEYKMHLELVDCPLNKPSVFAGYQFFVLNPDDGSQEYHFNGFEPQILEHWKDARYHFPLEFIDLTPRRNLKLKIQFEMFDTPSSWIQNNNEGNIEETLLLFQNKSRAEMSNSIQSLLEQEGDNFSDFKIRMKDTGKEFKVHKHVLASKSSFFRTLFNSDEAAGGGVMGVDDLSTQTMEILLKFIYSGTMTGDWHWTDVIQELVYAGQKYEIKNLTELCDTVLIQICSIGNAVDLLKLARQYNLKTAEIEAWILKKMSSKNILDDL